MIKAEGETRRVYVFKHIVVKVARIYWLIALKTFYRKLINVPFFLIKRNGMKNYLCGFKERRNNSLRIRERNENERIEKEKSTGMRKPSYKRYEMYYTVSICLFRGIMANYQEWKFYRKTKNIFVMPTYFSFLGLVNIQKKGDPITFWKSLDVWRYVISCSQNMDQPYCDGHTLSSVDNFCLDNGHLKMVDYGSRHLEPFLELNSEKLYNNFKIPN